MRHLLAILFFLPVSPTRSSDEGPTVTDIDSFFGTSARKAIVQHAEQIEVSVLEPKNPNADFPSFRFDDYQVRNRFVASEELRKDIVALLLNPSIYRWPDQVMPDGSILRALPLGWRGYHVRVTIRAGEQSLDIGISCYSLVAVVEGEKIVSTAHFGSNGDFLFKLCRSLFPDDPRLLHLAKSQGMRVRDPEGTRR